MNIYLHFLHRVCASADSNGSVTIDEIRREAVRVHDADTQNEIYSFREELYMLSRDGYGERLELTESKSGRVVYRYGTLASSFSGAQIVR